LISVLADLKGRVLGQEGRALSGRPDPEEVTRYVEQSVGALVARAGIDRRRLLGVGVAVSGIVDASEGVVRHSAILGWDDVPLADGLGQRLGTPVLVENDANSVATFEHLYGSARGTDDFALVTVGRGVGGAQFVAGRLQRGHDDAAGELAHCTIDPGGRLCACGKHGCLDTIAASGALVRAARERGLQVSSVTGLEALAQRGDADALAVLREAAAALGLAVSHLIHLTDPGLVLIAGAEISSGTVFTTAVRQAVERNLLPRRLPTLRLAFRTLEPMSWAQGAAALATHSFLTGRLTLPA
jgi:predicted NBD/HSP70 family sugar kinase